MPLVKNLERSHLPAGEVEGEAQCSYSVFSDAEGRKYLQLETFPETGLASAEGTRQRVQLGEEAVRQLRTIISNSFATL